MATGETNSLDRLVNTSDSFEGTSLPPAPKGGFRVPVVNGFRVLRTEPWISGAFVTFTWTQENLSENNYFEIFIYNNYKKPMSSEQNWRDNWKGVPKTTPIINGFKASEPPVTIFIPTLVDVTVTAAITTRHSSGVLSDYTFLGETTVFVTPNWVKYLELTSGTTTLRADAPNIYAICDATGGNITVNLPQISQVSEGFPLRFIKVDAGANTVALTPTSTDEVDFGGAGVAYTITTHKEVVVLHANRSRNCWIKLI